MGTKCPKCETDNPSKSKFCMECATPLPEAAEIIHTQTYESARKELTTGSTFAGRYQVIEELGKGGMGRVYKVLDTETKEKIALKLIKPEIASDKKTVERFRNELTTARKIVQKNVCRMFDLNREQDNYYITMEYVSGGDLKRFIRRSGQLNVGKAISIAKQICEGLSEAHNLGIVHRDLKPNNIMIDDEGNARIMDFGIARTVKEKGITGSGVMIGTPEYMSPEQAEAKDIDHRSDLYSLGVVLYEMVTGKMPFEGDTPLAIAMKHKGEPPKIPKEYNAQIPDDLSKLILKCLEKDRENRYQIADELSSELTNIEKGIPTTERAAASRKPLTSKEITVQFSVKKLFVPLLMVCALVIATVILIWHPWSQETSVSAPKIENSIAVINFKNQTGNPAYDHLQEAIPNLLITNLENTELFYVATWERMKDILKQMGVKQAGMIDSDDGFALCRREGIKAIAIGTFSMAGDIFTTDVKVYDVETKQTLKSANDRGAGVDSIFDSQIDNLSREISLGLGAAMDKVEAARLNIKDITTHSLEAYKYFLKGKEACNLHDWRPARENLLVALELDPAFAMAYVYLAWTYIEPGPATAINETIEKAMAFSDRTSQKDRLYLDGLYAYFVEHDTKKAVKFLDELIQKYPDEKWAFHIQGDFLRKDDDLDRAYTQYKRWLELDPQDPNAFYHLSYVSVMMGNLEIAEKYIKMHEAVAPPDAGNLGLQA
ncbi:protein kinase, partial [Acidobacteriota bacterium]